MIYYELVEAIIDDSDLIETFIDLVVREYDYNLASFKFSSSLSEFLEIKTR